MHRLLSVVRVKSCFAGSLGLFLDVKLSVRFSGFQHEFIQLADLVLLEVAQFPIGQVGPELDWGVLFAH